MTENRRQYPRYEIELDARIYATELELSVAVVDISEGG
jgi:c-di-GMP-binding flagellar brake protein YcgR